MSTTREALTASWRYYQAGNWPQAEETLRALLRQVPRSAEALCLLGAIAQARGKTTEAVAHFREALRARPDYTDALNNLGAALARLGQFDEAIACFRQAVRLQPADADAHNNLGNALRLHGDVEEAVAALERALRLSPDHAEAWNNLGLALARQEKVAEALASFRKAVQLRPEHASNHNNLGIALLHDDPEEAAACLREAVRLQPDYVDARNNLGHALRGLGRYTEAMTCFDTALRQRPDHSGTHHNRALLRLQLDDYQQGWAEYEWRWQCPDFREPPYPQPRWDGTALQGRTILLRFEQGIGDTLHFIRYARLVKERGGTVLAACPKNLTRLLSTCPGIDRLLVEGSPLPAFDVHAPLLSLPALFDTTLATVPATVPYLSAEPALVEQWRAELRTAPGFKIGIVWSGNPKHKENRARSMPLTYFSRLAEVPGVQLISLQKGAGSEQLREQSTRFPILDLGSRLDETTGAFVDTAAVMRNLDLVVCCDTAVAHLAGALGVPVWLALSFSPDWRWGLQREHCPWYPTARLFRQPERENWAEVFTQIQAALRERLDVAGPGRPLRVEVAAGELLDKITILEIKAERLADPEKLRNVRMELATLTATREQQIPASAELTRLVSELKAVNEALWQIEDAVRQCEHAGDFGARFVELARSVYHQNDRRATLKRRINDLLGSRLVEEKSYAPYPASGGC
jgi:Flp pilus assembly protein TadD